jgi:hypothetical protein
MGKVCEHPALQRESFMVASVAQPASRSEAQSYFVWLAGAIVLLAFGGFSITYWGPLAAGSLDVPPVVHLHGLLFSAWTLFFFTQAWLATHGGIASHRAFGLFGIALATAMVFVGAWTALEALQSAIERGFEESGRRFAIVPISGIIFFAIVVGLAVANVRRPETHMRLMLLASISILHAAVGRITRAILAPNAPRPGEGPPAPVEMTYLPGALVDLLLVAAMFLDWRTRGKIHPVYLIGGAALVAVQFSRGALSQTPLWQGFLDWLLRIVG